MSVTFPGESSEYRAARDRLLQMEVELRRQEEAVARARRALPAGGPAPHGYVFEGLGANGAPTKFTLAELFGEKPTLAVYSFMFGPERTAGCPMCSALLSAVDAVAEHIEQRLALCVVAEAPLAKLLAFAEQRGWRRLRMLSAAGSPYNRDYHGKTAEGDDTTMLNLFRREGEQVRHFWGTEMSHAPGDPGEDHRALDMLNPAFSVFDLTPEGRGNFYTKLRYP